MSEDPPATDEKSRLTRRGLLAAAGMSAVAGCSSVDSIAGGRDASIRGYDLPDVDAESVPEPVVAPSVPVAIDPAYFVDSRDRATELLAELPTPLGPTAVPNGHVRKHLTDAADTATDHLDDARTARTDLVALQAFRGAREHARYAAAGWAVANSGLSPGSLQRAHQQIAAEAQSTRDAHAYVGADPVRAALVHARIERWLHRAADSSPPRTRDEGELLTVAEWGETVEAARAHLEDADHLDAQYGATLPDDVGTVEEALTRAADTLAAAARSRRSDLPPEPTPEEWGLAERVVHDLRRDLDRGPYRIDDADGPASAVVDLVARLAEFRALDRIQERVDTGAVASAESAEAVRDARTTAYDALDAVLADSPDQDLARTVLSDVSWRVSHADRELDRKRSRGTLSPASLDDVMERYIVATAVSRATPAVCRQAIDALESN